MTTPSKPSRFEPKTDTRRIRAMTRLLAPFTTEQLENAASFEQLIADTVVERNKLQKEVQHLLLTRQSLD